MPSDAHVSRLTFPTKLGFGTSGLGTLDRDVSEREAAEILAEAYETGFRYFDTSPFYGHGLSELRLGSFLRTVPRESVMVSTKAGRYMVPPYGEKVDYGWWAAPLRLKPVFDYSYNGAMRSLEQSANGSALPTSISSTSTTSTGSSMVRISSAGSMRRWTGAIAHSVTYERADLSRRWASASTGAMSRRSS